MTDNCPRCGSFLPDDGFCPNGCTGDRKDWTPYPEGYHQEPRDLRRPGLWPKQMAILKGEL